MSNEMIMIVIFLCSTFFFLGLGYFVMTLMTSEQTVVQKRFENISKQTVSPQFQKEALNYLKEDNSWKRLNFFEELPPFMNLPALFAQAGMKMNVFRWLITVVVIAGLVGAMFWVATQNILVVMVMVAIALVLPYFHIVYKRKKRLSAFEAGLAQALELTSRSLRSGHPLTMGMKMVASEMPDPIGTEFGIVYYEQQMGLPFEEAMRRMAQRVPILDLRFFVLTVLIHQQIGGDLSEVLDNLAKVIRERFKVLGQVKALTAEGRLSGWVLSALPIIVYFMIIAIHPDYIRVLIEEEMGRKAMYAAAFLQIIGMIIIQKIVRIKV